MVPWVNLYFGATPSLWHCFRQGLGQGCSLEGRRSSLAHQAGWRVDKHHCCCAGARWVDWNKHHSAHMCAAWLLLSSDWRWGASWAGHHPPTCGRDQTGWGRTGGENCYERELFICVRTCVWCLTSPSTLPRCPGQSPPSITPKVALGSCLCHPRRPPLCVCTMCSTRGPHPSEGLRLNCST